jgi:hypothetical protein
MMSVQAPPEEENMFPDHHVSLRSRLATAAVALSISLTGAGIVAAQDATPAGDAAAEQAAAPVVEDQAVIDELTQVVTTCAPEGATNLEVHEVHAFADGRYAVDYQFLSGKQLIHLMDSWSNQTGTWTLENRTQLSPESNEDTITASVKIGGEAGLELSPAQFPLQPAVNFHVNNQGDSPITFGLYSGPADFDVASISGVTMDAVPDTLSPIGTAAVPGTTELDVVFEQIEAGSYVIVVFDASGAATNAALVTIDEPVVIEVPDVVGGEGTATPAS